MKANILSFHTPAAPGVGSNIFFFLKVVMLLIKLKGMEHRAPCKHIFCPYTPSTRGLGQKVKTFFSECGLVAYQIKEKEV